MPTLPLPSDARRSLLIYNLLFPFVFLALLPGLLLRMLRRGNYREAFAQRFGRFSASERARFAGGGWIWIHSISVGETMVALKLAQKIRELAPEKRVALSVTTSTGLAVAKPQSSEGLAVIYNPVDARSCVRRTLDTLRPERLIFIEAIWPNLLAEARRRGVPVGFVPRLSPRSERRFRRFRALTGPIFRLVDTLAVPEAEDVARWEALGVSADRLRVTGNAKFDQAPGGGGRSGELREVLDRLGVTASAPILLAGSTFPGEEKIVAEVFRELRARFPELFLIIVPRHVERTDAVLAELRPLGLRIALRTAADAPADLLVVNTTGELRDWYALATVVFIGKSLTSTGGQNPVEAVLAGQPVVFGPHMENFQPIVARWLAADAAVQVRDAAELREAVARLLADPARRILLASRAREIAAIHQGATALTARELMETTPDTHVEKPVIVNEVRSE